MGRFALWGSGTPAAPDNYVMSASPAPGMPVVVVQRTAEPIQWQGELVAVRDASLAIRLAKPPASWDPMLPYFVICGQAGSRVTAPVNFVAHNANVAAFKMTARWKPLDFRRQPRVAADLTAEVRSVLGNSRQAGKIIDISLGGAAVSVDSRPGGSQVEVGIWAGGYGAHILCDVVSSSQGETEVVLHLKFRDLSPPHVAFIRQLVGQLQAQESRAS